MSIVWSWASLLTTTVHISNNGTEMCWQKQCMYRCAHQDISLVLSLSDHLIHHHAYMTVYLCGRALYVNVFLQIIHQICIGVGMLGTPLRPLKWVTWPRPQGMAGWHLLSYLHARVAARPSWASQRMHRMNKTTACFTKYYTCYKTSLSDCHSIHIKWLASFESHWQWVPKPSARNCEILTCRLQPALWCKIAKFSLVSSWNASLMHVL